MMRALTALARPLASPIGTYRGLGADVGLTCRFQYD